MATSRTRNLRLFLSSGLSTEAKANLEILDRLGGVYQVDNSEAVNIRSKTDIRLLPGDVAAGGVGNSNVEIGSASTPVASFIVHTTNFELNGSLRLPDYLVPLVDRKYLTIRYNSKTNSGAADTADRELTLDVQGGNRQIILAQDLELAGGFNTKLTTTAVTNVTLPTTGTLATRAGVETLTNKTLTAPHITAPTGITKADVQLGNVDNYSASQLAALPQTLTNKVISGTANTFSGIPYSALSLAGQIKNADISAAAAIEYEKLTLTGKVKNSDVHPLAAIAATKVQVAASPGISAGTLQSTVETLKTDINSRTLSSDFELHTDAAAAHGTTSALVGVNDVQTLTQKTINANNNTLTNIKNASIGSNAGIEYSKLNLLDSLRNADWSDDGAHKLQGTKVAPNFGTAFVETEAGVKIGQGYTTELGIQAQTADLVFKFPPNAGGLNFVLTTDGLGNTSWTAASGTGTVSKVGLSAPSILSVTTRDGSGTPIAVQPGDPVPYVTATGYFDIALANQTAATVLAGPESGTGAPTFRALVEGDLPSPLNSAAARNQAISDQVSATLKPSVNNAITWTYNPGTREVRPTVSLAPFYTTNLQEGSNLYYTNTRVKTLIPADAGTSSGVTVTHTGTAPGPESISLALNQAAINTDNITEGSTNKFFSNELAQDAIDALLIDSTEIAKNYDDNANSLSFSLKTTSVAPGPYGDASSVAQLTVDSKGRITQGSTLPIAITSSQVTDFTVAVQAIAGSGGGGGGGGASSVIRSEKLLFITNHLFNPLYLSGVYYFPTSNQFSTAPGQGYVNAPFITLTLADVGKYFLVGNGFGFNIWQIIYDSGSGSIRITQNGSYDIGDIFFAESIFGHQNLSAFGYYNFLQGNSFTNGFVQIFNTYDYLGQITGQEFVQLAGKNIADLNAYRLPENLTFGGFGSSTLAGLSAQQAFTTLEASINGVSATAITAYQLRASPYWLSSDGTTKAIEHALGRGVIVQLYNTTTGLNVEPISILRENNMTTITVASAPPVGEYYRVMLMKGEDA